MAESERKIQIRMIIKLLCACVFASLYAWGGMEWLPLRRFAAPIWLGLSMFYFCRNWKILLQIPVMMLTLSLGYGADELIEKILKRFIFALLNSSASGVLSAILYSQWILFDLHLFFNLLMITVLGVLNPIHARGEELLIGLVIGLLPLFMVQNKEV